MAAVTNKEIPEIFQMFGDAFNLLKKYYKPEPQDDYWEQLRNEIDIVYKKYKSQLCKDVLLAIANDIDRRFKERG
jgi:hypothetical protein